MARSRNLKPIYFLDEDLADLGPLHQILYWGLSCLADSAGRLEDKPRTIKANLFPFYDADVDSMLDDLATARYLSRYIVSESRIIQIRDYENLYTPHKNEPESVLPLSDAGSRKIVSALDLIENDQEDFVSRTRARQNTSHDKGLGLGQGQERADAQAEVEGSDVVAALDRAAFANRVTALWNDYPSKRRNLTDIQLGDLIESVADTEPATLDRMAAALAEDLRSKDWREGVMVNLTTWVEQRRWDRDVAEPDTLDELRESEHPADRRAAELMSGGAA